MTGPLRIAVVVGCFPVVSETFILRQITGLLDLGHEVEIIADTRGEGNVPLQPEVEQYRLLERTTFMEMPEETAPWELPVWPLTGRTWKPGAAVAEWNVGRVARALPHALHCLAAQPRLTLRVLRASEYGFQARSLSALYRLAALSRPRRRFDVIHAHFGPNANSFRFARDLWHAPLVASFHGYDFCTLPRQQGPGMYRRLFDTADVVTANSEFTRGRVQALGCPAAKLQMLPMGLDPQAFPFRERTARADEVVRLVTVARLVAIKGHEFVLRSLARARARHPRLHYDLVGDGPLRSRLDALVRELGLERAVTFHGARDSAYVARLMGDAHLAVLASVAIEGDAEGQGLFLQEAQACGLPVIATRHGGLPEGMREGKSGFLVPERDAEALEERLTFLVSHPERWPELGKAGRALVEERFDIRRLNARLVEFYRTARRQFRNQQTPA